jgi:hypothetical protein
LFAANREEPIMKIDLLVGHFMLHPLQLAAEKAGKPYATVSLNHGAIPAATFRRR